MASRRPRSEPALERRGEPPGEPERALEALRGAALAMFVGSVALTVAAIVLADGLAARTGNAGELSADPALITVGLASALTGLLLSWARPHNPVGWLLALSALLSTASVAGGVYGARALVVPGSDLPAGTWALALSGPLWLPALFVPVTALLVRYPTGEITGRWQRRFDRSFTAGAVLVVTGYAASDVVVTDVVTGHANPVKLPDPASVVLIGAGVVLAVLGLVGIVAAALARMVRGPRAERAALAWLFVTTTLAVGLIFTAPTATFGNLAFVGVPVAIAVGVLRYRLLGIELVVRRTLLYGTLTGLVLGVFVAVTAALAAVLPSGPTPEVVAATLIAVGLAPARDRVQRIVDRVFYGDRGNPLGAFARLGNPLTGPVGADPLPSVLAGLGEALRVPSVALTDTGGAVVGSWGSPPGPEAARVPLRFAGADLGALVVGTRAGQRRLGRADRELVETVAPLFAAAVLAGRLAADVRAEQARVLGAAHTERARLRSDLHDGLGPSLTGVGLGLEALQHRVPDDPRTGELLSRLRTEVAGALEEVRRIIEDLHPASSTPPTCSARCASAPAP